MYVWIEGSLPGTKPDWVSIALQIMSEAWRKKGFQNPLVVAVTLAPAFEEARKFFLSARKAYPELWIIPGFRLDSACGKTRPELNDIFLLIGKRKEIWHIADELGEILLSFPEAFHNTLQVSHMLGRLVNYPKMTRALEESLTLRPSNPTVWWADPFVTAWNDRTEETEKLICAMCNPEYDPYSSFRFMPRGYFARGQIRGADMEDYRIMKRCAGANRPVHPVVWTSSTGDYPPGGGLTTPAVVRWSRERTGEPPLFVYVKPGDITAVEEMMTCVANHP